MTSKIIKGLLGMLAALALALGITAGATATASAAGGTVWDRVAQCESGQNWKINRHTGYYGGLQFLGSTWRAYGGRQYAPLASQASRAEQIAIARRVLADVGPRAWPTCGRRAHLTRANGKADRHATPATNPGSARSTSGSHSSSSASFTQKQVRFAHLPAIAKKTAHRKFIPGKTVRVQRGDTLVTIAARNHVSSGWTGLWRLNTKKFTWQVRHGHRIFIGQIVRVRA